MIFYTSQSTFIFSNFNFLNATVRGPSIRKWARGAPVNSCRPAPEAPGTWGGYSLYVYHYQGHASFVRNETAAILDIFQYRSQTSDFSIVYNLSLPAMWSGYVIVFRACCRNRGCFRIAAVLRTTVPVPKWFVKQPRFWNRGCSNDGISPTKTTCPTKASHADMAQNDTIHTVSS